MQANDARSPLGESSCCNITIDPLELRIYVRLHVWLIPSRILRPTSMAALPQCGESDS